MTKIPKTTPGPQLRLIGRPKTIVGLLLATLLLLNVDCGGGSGISQGTGGNTGVTTGVGGSGGGAVQCGGPGQPCCGGNSCTSGGCCIASAAAGGGQATRVCVGSGQACAGTGVSGLCTNGSCSTTAGTPCGALAQACCPGGAAGGAADFCTASGARCVGGTCTACGGSGQACCPGRGRQSVLRGPALSRGHGWRQHLQRMWRLRAAVLCQQHLQQRAWM